MQPWKAFSQMSLIKTKFWKQFSGSMPKNVCIDGTTPRNVSKNIWIVHNIKERQFRQSKRKKAKNEI